MLMYNVHGLPRVRTKLKWGQLAFEERGRAFFPLSPHLSQMQDL